MAIIEKSRVLRPKHGDELVILVDCFGTEHHVYIAIAAEKCPHCQRSFSSAPVDAEKEIQNIKESLRQREETLLRHANKRGYDVSKLSEAGTVIDKGCADCS